MVGMIHLVGIAVPPIRVSNITHSVKIEAIEADE